MNKFNALGRKDENKSWKTSFFLKIKSSKISIIKTEVLVKKKTFINTLAKEVTQSSRI
jgi:hypothetical protein